jgi:hypothetical protein
LDNKSNITVI